MLTLTYGLKVPETNDRGAVVFPAIEDNFTQLDGHDHDGANSKALTGASIASSVVTVLAAGWGADLGGGYYKQTVNVPTGISYDACSLEFRVSDGTRIYPKVTRISAAQIEVWVSDNTLELKANFN